MGIHLVIADDRGKRYEFDLITSFDDIHWWAFCITLRQFSVLTLNEELCHGKN